MTGGGEGERGSEERKGWRCRWAQCKRKEQKGGKGWLQGVRGRQGSSGVPDSEALPRLDAGSQER